jgi:predicted neuraminidase
MPGFELAPRPGITPVATAPFTSAVIPRPPGVKEVHGSSLVVLPNDELLTVCYGGTTESDLDVKLYMARYTKGQWQPFQLFMLPPDLGMATLRYTRRVGNSSLFRDAAGKLHLFFVSVGYFGWSCTSINHMISLDEGHTWSPPKKVLTTPFFNVSALVRGPAVPLKDGGFLLPTYFEVTNKFPEALQFNAAGEFVRKIRMTGEHGSLQPCIVPNDERHAHAFLRNRLEHYSKLCVQTTSDGGATWTPTDYVHEIPNYDACVAAVQLEDGSMLMAYNSTGQREDLYLALKRDGQPWKTIHTLDKMKLDAPTPTGFVEFSYPTMLRHGNVIDLTYSYNRAGLRHCRFTSDWVKEQLRD